MGRALGDDGDERQQVGPGTGVARQVRHHDGAVRQLQLAGPLLDEPDQGPGGTITGIVADAAQDLPVAEAFEPTLDAEGDDAANNAGLAVVVAACGASTEVDIRPGVSKPGIPDHRAYRTPRVMKQACGLSHATLPASRSSAECQARNACSASSGQVSCFLA